MIRFQKLILASCATLVVCLSASDDQRCFGQETTWTSTASSGNWFEASRWNNGIPNAAGAIAKIPTGVTLSVQLNQQATLGQLQVFGPRVVTISGSGPLMFDRPGVDPAVFQLVTPTSGTIAATVSTSISTAVSEQLLLDLGQSTTLALSGGFTSTAGNVTKSGAGALTLSGGSANWGGRFFVTGGTTTVTQASAFGLANSNTVVSNGAVLTLPLVVAEPMELNNGTLVSNVSTTATFTLPIQLAGNGAIRNSSATTTANFNGIIDGPGNLTIQNNSNGALVIGGSNTYLGHTFVSGIGVRAVHASSFGSALEGTTVQSGALSVEALTNEKFLVQNGTLTFTSALATYNHAVTLDYSNAKLVLPSSATLPVPVVVQAGGGTVQFPGSNQTWTGGSSGVGNLRLNGSVKVNTPLLHQGSLTIQGAALNVANAYAGETIVVGNSSVNHVGALETSPRVRIQQSSTLTLNSVPDNDPDFVLETGNLEVNSFTGPINGSITFAGGGTPTVKGHAIYNGAIHLDTTSGNAYLRDGTFNGTMSGSGNVAMGATDTTVTINGNNTYTGISRVSGPVTATTSHALGSAIHATVVGGDGILNLQAPSDEPIFVIPRGILNVNAPVSIMPRLAQGDVGTAYRGSQTVMMNVPTTHHVFYNLHEGLLQLNADTTIDKIEILNGGSLVANQATLTTSAEIGLEMGSLEGHVVGASAVRKTTNEYARIGSLPGFDGDVIVEKGILQIDADDALGTPAKPTYVQGSRDTALVMRGELTIRDDIFLNNAKGIDNNGGLRLDYAFFPQTLNVNMQGRLDLGAIGSTIGGASSSVLNINGPLTGGSLTTIGPDFLIQLNTAQSTYTGPTLVREGTLSLAGNGRLSNTSAIVLYDDLDSEKGQLYIDNSAGILSDRVADSIPIEFRGGLLRVQDLGNERFGSFAFDEGESVVEGQGNLSAGTVSRQAGSTAFFFLHSSVPIDNAPAAINNVLPWMIVRDSFSPIGYDSFGTVVSGKIQSLPASAYVSNINTAAPSDNVLIAGVNSLTSDKSINALAFQGSGSLNLGTHTLQVQSGGIIIGYGGKIENGKLTAGIGSNELIFHSSGQISADIIDSGQGPVDVTISPAAASYNFSLSGSNTYTGTTHVNTGSILFTTPQSIPVGADLQITGGNVSLSFTNAVLTQLGSVRIAYDGLLKGNNSGTLSLDDLLIEEGSFLPGKLVGNAPIVKRTPGTGSVSALTNSTYTGDLTVEGGRLKVTGLGSAHFFVQGGTLELPTGTNPIALAGGALEYLYLTGNISVTAPSRIIAQPRGNASNYGLAGSFQGPGDLTFENRPVPGDLNSVVNVSAAAPPAFLRGHSPAFSGNVTIDTAIVSLTFEDSLGTGGISVRPGGTLVLSPPQNGFAEAKLDLPNTVYLSGGELAGTTSSYRPQRLIGDLYVSGNSRIGTLEVAGTTHLANGSHLTTTQYYDTRLIGDVLVGGTVNFNVGRTIVRTSGFDSTRAIVQFGGRIVSDSAMSMLKIENAGLDDLVLATSFFVKPGQSLGILLNGEAIELTGSVTGGGTLLNPVRIADGGHLSPGQSPGTLHFGSDLTIGPAAIYDWEINNGLGSAGTADGWDLVSVAGHMAFTATAGQPFVVRVIGLDTMPEYSFLNPNLAEGNRWLIASASSIAGFDPLSVSLQPVASPGSLRTVFAQQLSLTVEGGNLYLSYQVPEPNVLAISLVGINTLALRRRKGGPARNSMN